jgi:hypothetical protein
MFQQKNGHFSQFCHNSALPAGLTERTLRDLRRFFEAQVPPHRPSNQMWEALSDAVAAMQTMAEGSAAPSIYLSSLDPGVGKTQAVVHFIRALLASKDHRDVGALVCVSRLKEIRKLAIDEMKLADADFPVVTAARNEENALGCGNPDQARVIFTTQQWIEARGARGQDRPFADIERLHYRGQPRQVRVWDESCLPGRTLTLNRDDLGRLFRPLRYSYPRLTDAIEDLFVELRQKSDGELVTVPDFATQYGVDLNDALRVTEAWPTASPPQLVSAAMDQSAVSDLWPLFGKTVSVRKDGAMGATILDYVETLPKDIGPLLVLDASGRVRATYTEWEEKRGGLVRLRSAPKRYDDLTVHVWNRSGGKGAFREKGDELAEGIILTVNSKPTEDWLVVVHREDTIGLNLEKLVRAALPDHTGLHFCTWGSHSATNEYRAIPNVILAGSLYYPASYREALGRLASGRRPSDGPFTDDELARITLGEHRHLLLQALCRGAVRLCVEDRCAPCDAYLIASVRSGIRPALGEIFPGCKITDWRPIKRTLKGKLEETRRFVTGYFTTNPDHDRLRLKDVQKAIGEPYPSTFRNNIRRNPGLVTALAEDGIVEQGRYYFPEGNHGPLRQHGHGRRSSPCPRCRGTGGAACHEAARRPHADPSSGLQVMRLAAADRSPSVLFSPLRPHDAYRARQSTRQIGASETLGFPPSLRPPRMPLAPRYGA